MGFSIASDCASIVSALNNKNISSCDCGIIFDEILNLFCCNSFEGLVYTVRCVNRATHNIARQASMSNVSQVWKGKIPIYASSVVLAEKSLHAVLM